MEVARRIRALPLGKQAEAAAAALRIFGPAPPRFDVLTGEERDELVGLWTRVQNPAGVFDPRLLDAFDEPELEKFDMLLTAIGLV
jgi:hypothetical protein